MFTAEKVWHASEWLWWCGMCVSVCVGVGEGSGSTLRVVNLRVGLLIILWVIYATSKSWIGYLKHYTTLSYIMFGPHACIGGPLGHSPSCGYQRRAHSLARKGFQFPPTTRGIWPKGGFILACVWCGSWWDSISKFGHVRTHESLPPAWSEGATHHGVVRFRFVKHVPHQSCALGIQTSHNTRAHARGGFVLWHHSRVPLSVGPWGHRRPVECTTRERLIWPTRMVLFWFVLRICTV